MILPCIHGTCDMWAPDGKVTVIHKEGGAYGGIRRYAECAFKRKVVEGNSKGCKHWTSQDGIKEEQGNG
jgi:hypothetical protein